MPTFVEVDGQHQDQHAGNQFRVCDVEDPRKPFVTSTWPVQTPRKFAVWKEMQEITDCTHRNAVVHIADPAREDQRQADVTQVTARTGVLAEHPERGEHGEHGERDEDRSPALADAEHRAVVEHQVVIQKVMAHGHDA